VDLLDRYLAEIKRHLPANAPRDVIDEIAEELQSRIDEGNDVVDVLRAYGHPRAVAAKYATHQYLIGPSLYVRYQEMLRLLLTTILGVEFLGGVTRALLAGSLLPFWSVPFLMLQSAIYIFAILTLVFAAIERNGTVAAKGDRWDPRTLPPAGVTPYPRRQVAFEFGANVAMMLLLFTFAGASHGFATLLYAPVTFGGITFASAWQPAYAGLVLGASIVALGALAVYINPFLTKVRTLAHVLGSGATIAGLGVTLRAGPLLIGASPLITTLAVLTVAVVLAGLAISAAFELWRLMSPAKPRTLAGI
jgi:hypothetical protein